METALERSGDSWNGLLKRYRITEIVDESGGWAITSKSGNTYHVKSTAYIDRESGSMGFRMSCTCPARKRCRHIDAVMDMRHAEAMAAEDCDATEIIERTD
jgi:hypothetical protein